MNDAPVLVISASVALPIIALGQEMTTDAEIPLTPPAYKMLRFDEDYSYMADQSSRTDWFDPAGGSDVNYFSTTISFLF